jgi:hypothetical protein
MMRYLCLVYIDAEIAAATSAEEWRQIDAACWEYNEGLKQSGHYITSNALTEPSTAMTVRQRGGKTAMTDGPFAETKEHLGGFFLIEAKDFEEAVAIGERSPLTSKGAIEIRTTTGF